MSVIEAIVYTFLGVAIFIGIPCVIFYIGYLIYNLFNKEEAQLEKEKDRLERLRKKIEAEKIRNETDRLKREFELAKKNKIFYIK